MKYYITSCLILSGSRDAAQITGSRKSSRCDLNQENFYLFHAIPFLPSKKKLSRMSLTLYTYDYIFIENFWGLSKLKGSDNEFRFCRYYEKPPKNQNCTTLFRYTFLRENLETDTWFLRTRDNFWTVVPTLQNAQWRVQWKYY